MKELKITFMGQATKVHKANFGQEIKYTVPIGNGYIGLFSSKRKANEFIGETNRFLNRCFYGLNRIYGRTFLEYRDVWPLLRSDRKRTKINLIEMDSKLKNMIQGVDHRMEMMLRYQVLDNGNPNFYLFKDLIRISVVLQEIHQNMMDVHLSRFNNIAAMRIEALGVEADTIRKNCECYGHKQLEVYTFDENTGTVLRAIS